MRAKWKKGWIPLFAGLLLFGCASSRKTPPQVDPAEQVRQENEVGGELAQSLESQIRLKRDDDVSVYLRNLAQRLAESYPPLKQLPLGVLLVTDRGGRWESFSLPGGRIYLSIGPLKGVEYENEVAGVLAIQLAHLYGRDVLERIKERRAPVEGGIPSEQPPESSRVIDFFGPAGVFSFSEARRLNAIDEAVGILYQAGYDPRGVISILTLFRANPAKSPHDPGALAKLLDRARAAIALRAPLRNPVVRSDEFLAVQKKIREL